MHEHSKKKINWNKYYQKEAAVVEFVTSGDTHAAKRNQFALANVPLSVGSALDVGCGNGYFLRLLKNAGIQKLVGVDASRPRINIQEDDSITFLASNVQRLPFDDFEFELVTSIEVLEHVPEIETAVREMARVSNKYLFALVPGYQKIPEILCPCCLNVFPGAGHLHSFTPHDLTKLFTNKDWKVRKIVEYQNFPFIDRLPIFRSMSVKTRQSAISSLQKLRLLEKREGYYLGVLAERV